MKFELGDFVGFVDFVGKGIIVEINEAAAVVETTDGFLITESLVKLVKYPKPKMKVDYETPIDTTHVNRDEIEEFLKTKTNQEVDINQLLEEPTKKKIKKVTDKSFQFDLSEKGETPVKKSSTHYHNYWEIDLHIHELLDDYTHLTNAEMVEYQLKNLRNFVNEALQNKIHRLIVIHGVGKGTLRDEVRYYFSQFNYMEFHDASYQKYGQGATEVKIYYSKK